MNIGVAVQAGTTRPALDLIDTFGPLSGMHAAMHRLGYGMPCGLIARFAGRTAEEVEAAIALARPRFPILQHRLDWIGGRPVLIPLEPAQRQVRAHNLSMTFKSGDPLWRYQIKQDGDDAWMSALWAHAAADGASMLHFAETVAATASARTVPSRQPLPPRAVRQRPMAGWLARFLVEQQLPYVRPSRVKHKPGIAWLTIAPELGVALVAEARARYGGFAAWLAASTCQAFCEQYEQSGGRVLLSVPLLRDSLERAGGFGFGIGSLLMPVRISPHQRLTCVAERIAGRLDAMIASGWDKNFDRFIGTKPQRHSRFAALQGGGNAAPIVSVSWKRADWQIGGNDGVRDVACFAASPIVHISGHLDRNGLSLSIASRQSPAAREELLHRIVTRLGVDVPQRILAFDGRAIVDTAPMATQSRCVEPVL